MSLKIVISMLKSGMGIWLAGYVVISLMHKNSLFKQFYNSLILFDFLSILIGLFTADQKLAGQTSIYTRQNANGARSGYECPEERDYYPYWYPTDWTDIAVFTDNTTKCEYYQRESFNVKPKGNK